MQHTMLHENIKKFIEGSRYDAHPMGMVISTLAALSTFYPDSKDISDAESRDLQTYRAIAKIPTIAAFAYRHSLGLPYIYPDDDLSYTGNFLNMMFHPLAESRYRPDPVIERALDTLFVLGAGLVGAVLWSGIIGGRASAAPPYLLSQSLLMLIGFTLATRGAPRWSYPWLAFGVVATSALLSSLIASDADPTPAIVIVAVATGPVLAVLLSTVISVRSWGDAYAFLALFLAGIGVEGCCPCP